MKIGFLITYFSPFTGGAETNCLELAKQLAKNGHEVHIFTSDRKDNQILEKEEFLDGIHIHRFRVLFRYKYYLSFYPSILKIIFQDFDIIHIHGFGFPQHDILLPFLKLKSAKLICTPHGPFMALPNYSFPARIYKKIYNAFLKIINRFYDVVIEVNPFQKSWMKNSGVSPEKIKFLPNGINNSCFAKIPKSKLKKIEKKFNLSGKFIISYLGRIQDYKGLEQIIKVLPEIKKSEKNILFLAMGDDAGDMKRLKKLAKSLGVEKNVLFTGKVTDDEKISLLELSEIFSFPSQWEAFGIATLEAMARGNAVISTKTEGGNFLIQKENGFLFDYNNLKDLKKFLEILIKSKILRKEMQKCNIKKAKSFLWSMIAKKLEKIYKNENP